MEKPPPPLVAMIGGPQGAGLETSAQVLTVAYATSGYRVLASREYHSNIIGRHSYILLGVDPEQLPRGHRLPVDVASFMDAESVFTHYADLDEGSVLFYDIDVEDVSMDKVPSIPPETRKRLLREFRELGIEPVVREVVKYLAAKGVRTLGVSYRSLLSKLKEQYGISYAEARRYISTVVAASVAKLTGLGLEELEEGLRYRFRRRAALVERNLAVARHVYSQLSSEPPAVTLPEPRSPPDKYMVVTGNEAVAIGKTIAGVGIQSYYPITPAQDESFYLEAHEEDTGILVFQTEDELAAIAAATGAALAGARAATATSGPGFDLMVEGLGWACITETPVVVTLYQRGGPSTGLPTRGSQEDLFNAVFAGHGECPRIVLASWSHEEALRDAVTAQNLAEEYQMLVIHVLDKFLANSVATMTPPRVEELRIKRGVLAVNPGRDYRRFQLPGPVSPFAPIGDAVTWYTGDEHDEYGHITEEPATRIAMVKKRFAKLELASANIPEQGERAHLYPQGMDPSRLDILFYSWGTAAQVAAEAVRQLSLKGIRAGLLRIRYFSPYPSQLVSKVIAEAREAGAKIVSVEHNYLAQAAKLATMNAGVEFDAHVLKYTGRPIYIDELLRASRLILDKGVKEVHLSNGA